MIVRDKNDKDEEEENWHWVYGLMTFWFALFN